MAFNRHTGVPLPSAASIPTEARTGRYCPGRRDAGRGWQAAEFVTLFTDAENPISNAVYQRVGFYPVCDYHQYRFVAARQGVRNRN